MREMEKYIYGIIPQQNSGQGHSTAHLSNLKGFPGEGRCTTNGVYTIPYQDISAVVSDMEMVDYTHMLKDALARRLLSHQKVIEDIMNLERTIIPVKLGTFAADEIEVKDILNKGYALIKEIMEKINGRIEIDVAATWSNMSALLKEAGEEKEIKKVKEMLLAGPKGITIDGQIKIGMMLKKVLDRKKEEDAKRIENALRVFDRDFKIHQLMDDEMVTNLAFLIDKVQQKDFDRKVEELNAEFKESLNFRSIGPLPPYSFYTLEIKKIQFEEIDWARKKLGLLNDGTDRDKIKKAYKRLAFSAHPDRSPDMPGKNEEFNEVHRAYKILLDYCLSAEQAGQGPNCSFKEENFIKNSLVVKVKE